MLFFSFRLASEVEKFRDAKRAAGGDGHVRGRRASDEAEHMAGRNGEAARDGAILVEENEAWRRAARHGRFEP